MPAAVDLPDSPSAFARLRMFLIGPLIGNGVMSLATLLTINPIAAVGAHIAMHIAAVLHGIDTAVQLPPHYGW